MALSLDKTLLEDKFSFTGKAKSKIFMLIGAGALLLSIGIFLLINASHGHGHVEKHEAAAPTVEHVTEHHEHTAADRVAAAEEHATEHHGKPVWLKRIIKDLWMNNVFFLGISLIGVFFVAFNYVAHAGWGALIKRIPEAFGYYLPIGAFLTILLLILFGHDLFHWMDPSLFQKYLADGKTLNPHFDEVIKSKEWYLTPTFFWVRTLIYLTLWILFWLKLRTNSQKEDLEGGTKLYFNSIDWSAGFLFVLGISSSMSAWDWIMSMDPHFFSTMFGWYVFASWFVSGLATITLVIIFLKDNGHLKLVNENHLHDMGKFMFGFSIFWTYVWFEQFLLIYYVNIPEEAYYFVERLKNPTYRPIFFGTFIINFIFPFLVLMTRNAKRQFIILKIAATGILIGHWFDFYMMTTPPMLHNDGGLDFNFLFVEVGMTMIFIGVFCFAILTGLTKAGLIAKNHPMIDESIHHHVY